MKQSKYEVVPPVGGNVDKVEAWKPLYDLLLPYKKDGTPMSIPMSYMDKICDRFVRSGGLQSAKKENTQD